MNPSGSFDVGAVGISGAGAVNQSGGLLTLSGTYVALGSSYGAYAAYGGYVLSAGTLNAAGLIMGQGTNTSGLFSQSGGSANVSGNFFIGGGTQGATSTAIVDISRGVLTHSGHVAGTFMDTGSPTYEYGTNTAGTGVLTVRSSGYLQETSGSFVVTAGAGATGIVNLLTGGTLEINQISGGTSGTSTINFDGGTLRVCATNGGSNFLGGFDQRLRLPGRAESRHQRPERRHQSGPDGPGRPWRGDFRLDAQRCKRRVGLHRPAGGDVCRPRRRRRRGHGRGRDEQQQWDGNGHGNHYYQPRLRVRPQ